MSKTTKINIGIALSRNYDKISLEFLDEAINYENEGELNEKIKTKFAFLKKAVLSEFEKEVKEEKPKPKLEKATEKQLNYLESLGFEGKIENLTKIEAQALIKELLENSADY